MKIVDIEKQGKKYKALVPDDAPTKLYGAGIIIGPPDLSSLGLPPSIEVRLNNELYVRGLITKQDIKLRMSELVSAFQFAFAADAQRLAELYEKETPSNG